MKVIIAGGRDCYLNKDDYKWLDEVRRNLPIEEVVCGEASGADYCGKVWAWIREIPVKSFPADWNRFGKMAGPKRNREMAEYADVLIAFPGGRGTAHMIMCMKDAGKAIICKKQ